MFPLNRKILVSAALLACGSTAHAGLLRPDIAVQTYRDFADNRGVFQAGATNVTVYNTDGSVNGVIAVVPDFSSVADYGSATMISASFGGTVEHVGMQPMSRHTYGERFNATGLSYSLFGDTYRPISDLTPGNDVQLFRYSKLFIDAAPTPLATDSAIITGMAGKDIVRIGGGNQNLALAPGVIAPADPVTGTNGWLTAGMNRVDSQSSVAVTDTVNDGVTKSYTSYTYIINMDAAAATPLQIGTQSGDSGSPVFAWNATAGRYEVLAFNSAGAGDGIGKHSYLNGAPLWMKDMIASYQSPTITDTSGGGVITMSVTNTAGAGTFTQGAGNWTFTGLANGLTSATATNAQLDATKNLKFAGAGNIIRLSGSVDMGAGTMEFDGGGTYTLDDNGVNTRRLNTGGFIVDAGTTLVSKLTGSAGDDWRKIGTGTFRIEGAGNNAVKLSLGEGLVELNRTGGYAADDVLITSGRGTVRLLGANQINGDIAFGHRGGTLDLYGTSLSRTVVYAMDDGARIANTNANTTSTFTWTGSGAGLEQTFRGGFTDGGSLANGLLHVVIAPATPAGAVLTLTGNSSNAGGYAINGGEVVLRGANTLHAGSGEGEDAVLRPAATPDDWTYASIATGTITVASGAKFTLADHARLDGDVTVNAGGTFAVTENLFKSTDEAVEGGAYGTPAASLYGHQSGTVNLNGATAAMVATVSDISDQSVVYSRNITGTGAFTKNGAGTLTLSGTNTFSGTKTLSGGTLLGASLAALGDTTTNKWSVSAGGVIGAAGATVAGVRDKLATNASGTLAILDDFTGSAPSLTGYSGLFLGSVGDHTLGTAGLNTSLTGWGGVSGKDFLLGGGGGTLTVKHKMNGPGALIAGNGMNTGVVELTRTNGYTGGTVVNSGVTLRTSRSDSLGSGNILVNYGGAIAPGTGAIATATFARLATSSSGVFAVSGTDANAYDFAAEGLNALALGADGTATYSGAITAGTSGYRFGGKGALTVSSALTGSNALSADGQGTTGGVTTLTSSNTFTGGATVKGGVVNGITGSHTLRVGSATALGSGALTLQDGGIVDLNGISTGSGSFSGTTASALTNGSATAVTYTVNQTAAGTMDGAITGAINLVKSGSGALTLTADNSRTGTLTVNAGTLTLTGDNSAGGATTIAAGATLQVGAGGATGTIGSGAITTNGGLVFHRGNNGVDMAGAIAGSGSVTYRGSGVASQGAFTLDDASTYSGGTTIDLARANLSAASAFGTGTVTVNAGGQIFFTTALTLANNLVLSGDGWNEGGYGQIGALRIGSTSTLTGNVTLAGNTRIGAGGSATGTLSGVISGASNLEIGGNAYLNGTIVLSGANAYSGDTSVNSASLTLANALALQNSTLATGGVTFDASVASRAFTFGGLKGSGALTLADNGANAVALTVGGNNQSTTYSGVLSGAGSLTKTGTGTLALTGANTYAGGTTVSAGTLQLGDNAATNYGATARIRGTITVSSGATLLLQGSNALGYNTGAKVDAINLIGGTLTHAGNGDNGWGVAYTLAGGTMQTTGAGRFSFGGASGANTSVTTLASATTSTIAGKVALRGDGNTNVNFTVADGAAATDLLVSADISQSGGTVGITKNGAGTLTLSGANTFAGGITVNQGRLNTSAASLGTGAITVGAAAGYGASYVSGGTPFLNITDTGNATVSNAVSLANPSSAGYYAIQKAGTGSNLTLTGVISGGGANTVLQLDSPTGGDSTTNFTLAGNNTFAGQLRLNRGYVTLTNANAAGTASIFLQSNANSSGNLRFSNSFTLNNAVTFGSTNGNTLSTDGNNVTLAGVVSGGAAWTKTGAGNLTLSGNNTYTGVTTVNAGRLIAGSNTAFGTGGVAATSGGTLSVGLLGAGRSLANSVSVASGGALAGTASLSGGVTLAAGAAYVWSIANPAPTVAGTDFDRLAITAGTFALNAGSVLKIEANGVDYSTAFWDSSRTFSFVTKSGDGAISGNFSTLDTSSAGIFSDQGSWTFASDGSGLSAVWTASAGMQGLSAENSSMQAVPEPSTYGLLGAGALATVALVRRRRRK